ncbi:MAG: sigma-54-dependent Fis family transcriptional regulator [Syntrophomonadaceae bacterium]|nr:sigma-54-dependent Fis family transcriptional regulator [Syntrophomonadaceae bacterium]MDD3889605.1 sigma-54-dependent Fis family transcriptional regulator [Syntrophomonadaceae bacterium]
MNQTDLPQGELYSVWKQFINSGKLEDDILDLFIAESWERSRKAGVDPYRDVDYNRSTLQKIKSSPVNTPAELIAAAYPIMEEIHESVRGSGFRVILTDTNGCIIHSIPNTNINLNWSEKHIGTNAIGTAIKTGQSIQICGTEHYSSALHNLTSSAAPIFASNGNLLTVLALTGPSSGDHSHVLSMLIKAAQRIIDQSIILAKNKQMDTYHERLTNVCNTLSDGVIIIAADGLIQFVNPAAEKIIGKNANHIIGTFFWDLFDGKSPLTKKMLYSGTPYSDVEIFIENYQGRIHCLASAQPSSDEHGNISGGMIILQSFERVHNLVNRFSGAHAECSFNSIIGCSKDLLSVTKLARIAAKTTSTVLLQGESGTGKEVFAQAIHNASSRHKGPFVAINCGAIPRELVGSELFGYVDGAFTGAKRGGRPGKFEMASGGTIFLDEIGDMPLELQVALLRVLQNKRVTRIGDAKEITVDVRFICATNKNLHSEIEKGNFREDLYYRLNVISIQIPPLRERRDDIPLLIKHYLAKLGKQNENIEDILEPGVMSYLMSYDWPGNVRELQNVIERLVCIASQRRINIEDLPLEITSPVQMSTGNYESSPGPGPQSPYKNKVKQILAEEESRQIIRLLEKYQGNKTQVAKEMGFSRMTLYRKIKRYNLSGIDA